MNITDDTVKSMDLDMRVILKNFLANMNLLTPKERSVIVRILNQLYPMMEPIEKDFYVNQANKEGKR